MNKIVIVYKGFTGEAELSVQDQTYHGQVVGAHESASFTGSSVRDLPGAFKRVVDNHLTSARGLGSSGPASATA